MVIVILGTTTDLLAAVYLLTVVQGNASDWNGRPTIFGGLAIVLGLVAVTVSLALLGHIKWAAGVAMLPLLLTAGAFVVLAAVALLRGGRWN